MIRVFVYARVSTNGQISGDGFPRQIESCQRFAASKGWHISRVFQESQSGADEFGDRKLLSEAMDLAGGASDTNIILVERADRIARDLVVGELFLRECGTRKISVYSADSGEELVNATADPTKVLIRQILGALSQWERSCIVRKLQAGRRAKAELTGKPCGGPPPNPYGDRGGIAQKNEERKVLKEIVALRRLNYSCARIAEHLRDRRIKTPHDCRGPNVPWQWSGKTVERLVNKWQHRPEMA